MSARKAVRVLNVYLDLKSPHAYLAIAPTLKLQEDYLCRINWMPFELSYVSLGVSTSVDSDRVRRPADDYANRKAKMYYATAREYAQLQGLTIRGPHQLLDSHESLKAMLYSKEQNLELDFITHVFKNGW
jgi:2-hydroxychromene-2-carboxylate isomerase